MHPVTAPAELDDEVLDAEHRVRTSKVCGPASGHQAPPRDIGAARSGYGRRIIGSTDMPRPCAGYRSPAMGTPT